MKDNVQESKENKETIEKGDENKKVEVEEEVNSNIEATQEELLTSNKEVADEEDKEAMALLLEKKEEEAKDYYNRLQRLQADFMNYKKRAEKEKSDIYLYANEKIAVDLLNIIDNLERAVSSADENQKDTSLFKGIELVIKQMKETLKKHGIEEIEALNRPFDMNLHHAVAQEESEAEADTVVEVFQKGYIINNRVLRPAMVKVAK
ncbi:nucleotide exchange factor GrpE [Alkaliphilus pronyensis]|uniref:nucleotide exchange factor GrpE n=1 Tax=Alkaliphilus pronyensis TaxID=1482732 RepID=UPI001FA99CA4|nr:nucleotide exchange factor GrpE [Alkaliphilus pronyensis]